MASGPYGGLTADLSGSVVTPTGKSSMNLQDIAALAVDALPSGGGALTGQLRPLIADNLSGAGAAQASAQLLSASVNISTDSSRPYRLPGSTDELPTIGTVEFRNKDAANPATIYPPEDGQIDTLGANNPISVPAGSSIVFQPGATAGQWWA